MSKKPVDEILERLVPLPQMHGDWEDVLARASVRERRAEVMPKAPRRRRLLVVAAAVAVLVAIAAPALAYLFGWIGRTDVSFQRSRSAPNVIKKQFADLGIGSPPRFAPQVLAGQTREVGRFRVRGKLRALWVAPTRNGGYCFLWENLFGGCRRGDQRTPIFSPGFGVVARRGESPRITSVEGDLTAAAAARIELVYQDGSHADIPFVYVSKPIGAGFFSFAIPARHQSGAAAPARIVLLDRRGDEIARRRVERPRSIPVVSSGPRPRPTRSLPTRTIPPSAPIQHGAADGVRVTAGANGAVVFHTGGLDRGRRAVLRRSIGYSCFKLTREYGIFGVRGLGVEGRLQAVAAFRMNGVKAAYDGCELASQSGHRWPDRFHSHAPAEIPLTAAGHRYFTDRATARDLALFVRAERVQKLRKEPGPQAVKDLRAAYPQLQRSPIRLTATPDGIAFSERSPTGKRFRVVVSHRRIVSQNLEPYALVF
jgi:hypothetical protein